MKFKILLLILFVPFVFGCNQSKGKYAKLIIGEWYISYWEIGSLTTGESMSKEISLEEAYGFYLYREDGTIYSAEYDRDWNNAIYIGTRTIDGDSLTITTENGCSEIGKIKFDGKNKFTFECTITHPDQPDMDMYCKYIYQRL